MVVLQLIGVFRCSLASKLVTASFRFITALLYVTVAVATVDTLDEFFRPETDSIYSQAQGCEHPCRKGVFYLFSLQKEPAAPLSIPL